MILLCIIGLFLSSKCFGQLTADPILQRTTLRAYDSNSMLINDQFDIPISKSKSQLHVETGYTYFMSLVEPGEYVLKKFSHTNMNATTVKSGIKISDYTGKFISSIFSCGRELVLVLV